MGGTAIRAPSDDLKNHTTVLTQLKEIAETGLGIRGNPASAYVKISDLVAAGLINYISGVISPGKTAAGGGSTVTAIDSITGTGTAGSPLKLVGDAASPGASQYYGTNGASALGFFALPAGSSPLTTKGDLYGYSVTNVRIPAGTNGQVLTADSTATPGVSWQTPSTGGGVPTTIPDLQFWFKPDAILAGTGFSLPMLQNSCPWYASNSASASGGGATMSGSLLNSLKTIAFTGSPTGRYNFPAGLNLTKVTIFVVLNPATNPAGDIICGPINSFELATTNSGGCALYIGVSNVAVIAINTSPMTLGSWVQANVTYDASTGAYAFRAAQAAQASGTSVHGITGYTTGIAYQPAAGTSDFNGSMAEIIVYNRVLTLAEIQSVESYLHTKWNV